MSTTEVVEGEATEMEVAQDAATNLFRTADPAEVLKRAQSTAEALMPVVRSQGLTANIGGREHLRVEAWQTLGAMLGVTSVCTWTHKLDNGWEARVEAQTLDGRVIGAAEAECLTAESTWKNRDDFAIRSMAQTRATSKALASVLRFVATLGGASGTPAEEMPRDAQGGSQGGSPPASEGQLKFLFVDGQYPSLFSKGGAQGTEVDALVRYKTRAPRSELTKRNASKLIEALKGEKDGPKVNPVEVIERWRGELQAGIEAKDPDALAAMELGSEVPVDTEGLDEAPADDVPWVDA